MGKSVARTLGMGAPLLALLALLIVAVLVAFVGLRMRE